MRYILGRGLPSQGQHADFTGEDGVAAHWMAKRLLVSLSQSWVHSHWSNSQATSSGWVHGRGEWGISAERRRGACDVSVARATRWSPGRARAVKSPKGSHIFGTLLGQNTTRCSQTRSSWNQQKFLFPQCHQATSSEKAYHHGHCKRETLEEFYYCRVGIEGWVWSWEGIN